MSLSLRKRAFHSQYGYGRSLREYIYSSVRLVGKCTALGLFCLFRSIINTHTHTYIILWAVKKRVSLFRVS